MVLGTTHNDKIKLHLPQEVSFFRQSLKMASNSSEVFGGAVGKEQIFIP